jgi:hypothetical protein
MLRPLGLTGKTLPVNRTENPAAELRSLKYVRAGNRTGGPSGRRPLPSARTKKMPSPRGGSLRRSWKQRQLRRHVEDRPGAIRQHRHVLEGAKKRRRVADAVAGPEAAYVRPQDGSRGGGFHDRHRVAVPAPDEEFLFPRVPPLGVGGALGHDVGERPDTRARRGAGATLRARRPAVAAPRAAPWTQPLTLRQLLRAGAMTRRRGLPSRGCERQVNDPNEDKC